MKKTLLVVLGIILSLSLLTGCSQNEISYLNLINKTQQIENTDVSGELTLTVPNETKITFTGEANVKENYYNLDISLDMKTPKRRYQINDGKLVVDGDNMYVSKNLVRTFIETNETATLLRRFDDFYSNKDFILFVEEGLKETCTATIPEELITAFKEYFEEYKTKVINASDDINGYTLNLDVDALNRLITEVPDFINKNKSELIDNEKYQLVEDLLSSIPFAELESLRDDISNFKGSYLEHTIDNYKTRFTNEIKLVLKENSETFINAKMKYRFNLKDSITKYIPDNFKEYKEIQIAENEVTEIRVFWKNGETESTALVYNNDTVIEELKYPYILKDDRIYLPLRLICEKFGETVEWDAENSKAYIVREDEKIDMTGMVVDGKTMLKVRDFEKLSYKIGYTWNEYGEHIAYIEK